MKRILFVCTGNTCRSPMAEAIFKDRMPAFWRGQVEALSAGTSAWDGEPASRYAVEVLAEKGIDLSSHRSRMLTGEMVRSSDLIVAMESKHRDAVLRLDPSASSKVLLLGSLDEHRDDADIEDPIGSGRDRYEATRDELFGLVDLLMDYVAERFEMRGG